MFLGLNLSDANTADDDIVFVQMRIVPSQIAQNVTEAPAEQQLDSTGTNGHTYAAQEQPAQALFKAISDCQELNPDPPEQGDDIDDAEGVEGVGFDETAPGATGWITSENMQDFVDENGEFRMPEGVNMIDEDQEGPAASGELLGAGIGRVRTANEADQDGEEDGGEREEVKWQRTS